MKILYAISLVCFGLLLWAAVAITRHIRRTPARPVSPSDPEALPSSHHAPNPDNTDPDTARRRFKRSRNDDLAIRNLIRPDSLRTHHPRFASATRLTRATDTHPYHSSQPFRAGRQT